MYKKYILLLIFFCVLFVLYPYDAYLTNLNEIKMPPSLYHLFGTDMLGRDLLARCIKAVQNSIIIGFFASFLTIVLGLICAILAGTFARSFWLGLFDVLLALPSLILAMFMQSVFNGGVLTTIIILALTHFAFVAKILDAEFFILKKNDFYLCAILLGSSKIKALFKELIPNCFHIILILFIFNIAHAIIAEAGISFFGFGINLEDISLGKLLNEGANAIFFDAWWMFIFPIIIFLLLLMPLFMINNYLQNKFGVNFDTNYKLHNIK